jgi:O-antigen ligase
LKRLNFQLLKLKWYDWALLVAAIVGLIGNAYTRSVRGAIIFTSFAALYFLIRTYVRDLEDLKKITPFFLVSSFLVIFYGIGQNIFFSLGLPSFEVMPGRPNATFPEPDWLGMFLAFLAPAAYAFIYFIQETPASGETGEKWKKFVFPYIFLALIFTLVIISVSRSAWLAVFFQAMIFLWIILTRLLFPYNDWQWRTFLTTMIRIGSALGVALGVIYLFNLTTFQLGSRAQSTGSGLQKITVSCAENVDLPEKINTAGELEKFNCRHINLEEIEKEKAKGNFIKEIYRDDPNVSIRGEIYRKSWAEIKKHTILGVGWGNIGKVLGSDERGASLNASNIFLDVWLGGGIFGFLAFLAVWVYIFIRAVLNYIKAAGAAEGAFAVFILTAWVGLTVSNLFNSGIFLGFFWLFIAVSFIDVSRTSSE